jgi:hypothetical protein
LESGTLGDLHVLREPGRKIPAPPSTIFSDPATRRLSTGALPEGATGLEAWRLAPGQAPERLATGTRGAAEVLVPDGVIWVPGVTYQFWLTARNAAGASAPGVATAWTAA